MTDAIVTDIKPVMKPLVKAVMRSLRTAFDPLSLFAAGEQGAWYDPSDLTTLYQDSAGTTPVTANGDPVGLMLDKSGNGNDASQSTASLKPIYRTDGTLHWLEFDGVDDWLAIPIAFMGSASDSNTTIAASKSTGGGIYLLGCTSDRGIMMLNGPTGYRGTAYTSGLHQAGASTGLFVSGSTVVASSKFDRAAGSVDIQLSTGYSDVTTFTPSDKLIPASSALGIRGTQVVNLFQGSFYGIVTNNTAMSETDRASAEAYLATKAGVAL